MYVYSKNIKDYPVIQYLFYLQFILIKTKIKETLGYLFSNCDKEELTLLLLVFLVICKIRAYMI